MLFLTGQEARSLTSRCSLGWFLVRLLSITYKQPPCCCTHMNFPLFLVTLPPFIRIQVSYRVRVETIRHHFTLIIPKGLSLNSVAFCLRSSTWISGVRGTWFRLKHLLYSKWAPWQSHHPPHWVPWKLESGAFWNMSNVHYERHSSASTHLVNRLRQTL